MDYNYFMNEALKLSQKAFNILEVPIGCVIVLNDNIIGYGYNRRNTEKNVLAHAEIIAINMACKYMNDWRLEDCKLFVTVEPCAMCAGAIIQSRIKEVIFGTYNKKFGCGGSVLNILEEKSFNHQCKVTSLIMQYDCEKIMKDFFKLLRDN